MNDGLYSIEEYIKLQNSVLLEFPVVVVNVLGGHHENRCFHEHDTMELAIITEGNGLHILDGKEALVRKGDVLLIPPHIVHAYENGDTPLEVMNIIFDGARLPIPTLDVEEIPLFSYFFPLHGDEKNKYTAEPIMHIDDDGFLHDVLRMCERLHDELTTLRPGNVFSSLIMFLNIVMVLLRYATPTSNSVKKIPFRLGEVLKYIDDNFTEQLTLEEIARKACMSVRSLQAKFKQATGYSIKDYIIRKRISLAKSLLIKNDERILDVAGTCGFNDISYFTRTFRRLERMTPIQFRLKHQNEKA